MIEKKCADKKFLCYKISDNDLIVEAFHTDEERAFFLNKNTDFGPINSLQIGI